MLDYTVKVNEWVPALSFEYVSIYLCQLHFWALTFQYKIDIYSTKTGIAPLNDKNTNKMLKPAICT